MAAAKYRSWARRRRTTSIGMTSQVAAMAIACALSCGAPVASAQNGVETSEQMLTNVAMLRVAAGEAATELLADTPLIAGDVVTVRPGRPHRSNWIVAETLARLLAGRGVEVHVIDDPSSTSPEYGGAASDPADTTADGSADQEAADSPSAQGPDLISMTAEAGAAEAAGVSGDVAMAAERDVSGEVGQVLEFRIAQFDLTYVGQSRSFVLGPKRVTRVASVDIGGRLRNAGGNAVEWVGQGDAVRVDRISRSQLAAFESKDYTAELPEGAGAMRYIEPVVVGGIVAGLVYLFYTNQN